MCEGHYTCPLDRIVNAVERIADALEAQRGPMAVNINSDLIGAEAKSQISRYVKEVMGTFLRAEGQ